MRKRMSRILAVMLTFALVASTAEVVNAEDVSSTGEEVEVVEEVQEEIPELEEADLLQSFDFEAMGQAVETQVATGSVTVMPIITGNEATLKNPVMTLAQYNSNDYFTSQAVALPKGTVWIIAAYGESKTGSCFGVYTDPTLQNAVDSTGSISSSSSYMGKTGMSGRIFNIPQAGNYYIGVKPSYSTSGGMNNVGLFVYSFNGGDRAVTDGTIIVGQKNAQTNYFSYTAPYTGYVLAATDVYSKIALCNSAKAPMTGESNVSSSRDVAYGVTAGKTYYFKVTSSYTNSNGFYVMGVKSGKISEKSGKKKSKAVTIKKKKTKSGTIQPGSSQADWYKFKLTGKKTVKIYFNGRSNDGLKITVYKGGKKIGTRTLYATDASITLKSIGKWSKGTYYMKVQRASKYSSGWYSLKWK